MKPYWSSLLAGVAPIKLYEKPGVEYNMGNLETFLFDQAGGAAATWISIYGVEKFQQRLRERRIALNPKYQQLLREYARLMEGAPSKE